MNKSPEERARVRRRITYALLTTVLLAVVWRLYVSSDLHISLWEHVASGVPLIVMGWLCVAINYSVRKKLTGLLHTIYFWIGNTAVCINVYVIVDYVFRGYRLLLGEEHTKPLCAVGLSLRFMIIVIFYCTLIWLTYYLKEMSEEYGFK